jgi:cyanophycinase
LSGVIALHGGGEFQAGDEPFLAAWLAAAAVDDILSVAIVPTAAARGRPDLVGEHGTAAIERVAAAMGLAVEVRVVAILDQGGAEDPELAAALSTSGAIHLPGGDPDLIPTVFADTAAAAALRDALRRGAAVAGASAGAMGLATWTWTPAGGMRGLDLLPTPLVVMPHADATSWEDARRRFGTGLPGELGILGLGERTGVLLAPDGGTPWRVVGEGEVRWVERGDDQGQPRVFRSGDSFLP